MKHRVALLLIAGALAALGIVAAALADDGPATSTTGPNAKGKTLVTVSGVSGNGLVDFKNDKLSAADLAALPQVTEAATLDGSQVSATGPTLASILTAAGVTYIATCKNDELRYWILVTGQAKNAAAEITAGELDPGFGNNVAILATSVGGNSLKQPQLIVPNDATDARDVADVTTIQIGRAAPQLADTSTPTCTPDPIAATAPPKGTVVVNGDVTHPLSLTYAQLMKLPQVTQTDTFLQGTTSKTVTETGPTLFDVVSQAEPQFQACNPNDDLRFYIEVTSSEDGYAVITSYAEISPFYNGNQELLSLTENGASTLTTDTDPRSTVPGDVKGGRYNFGSAVITVLSASGGKLDGKC